MDGDHRLPWVQPAWRAKAEAWIQAQLAGQGVAITDPIEQPHVRPWSTVLRVPTAMGQVFLKATVPALGHEPALTQALSRWRPDCMPRVLAMDTNRGWTLMADAGPSLRSVTPSVDDLHHWHRILPLYAGVQMEMAARRDELLALGTLDRRLSVLPAIYRQLLENQEALLIDQADGLSSPEYRRLQEMTGEVDRMAAELAAYGIPETLHHDDFHDANICVQDGRYVFFDWAESCVAHPFFSLLIPPRSLAYRLSLPQDAPELQRLRDVYLDAWTGYGGRTDLLRAFDLAQRLAIIARALTWHLVLAALDEPFRAQDAEAVPGWLQELLV